MIKTDVCPNCNSDRIINLLERIYSPPVNVTREMMENEKVPYFDERLWILFEKVLASREPVKFEATLCQACGFIFYNPRFTHHEIMIQAEADNTILVPKTMRGVGDWVPAQKKYQRAKRIYNLISAFNKGSAAKQRILDYGGKHGHNLVVFIEKGSTGYILDLKDIWRVSGTVYLGKDLTDLDKGDRYDIILLCHVMEHLNDPSGLLRDLTSHLADNGLIYVELPLGCFMEWKTMEDPTLHMNYYSEESLYKSLRMAGLDVIYLSTRNQWVTHGKMLCLNAIACKREGSTVTRFKTTLEQMDRMKYFWYNMKKTPKKHALRMLKKINDRIVQSIRICISRYL
ncbi:MAG: class I SAM-dependent methyltransferase [Sedimentisphaerales bacterium]|nr:class I SAM-dependent methyltransferase [Sedimentisphaerales bacterium]